LEDARKARTIENRRMRAHHMFVTLVLVLAAGPESAAPEPAADGSSGAAGLPVDAALTNEEMMGAMVVAEADAALSEAGKAFDSGKFDDVVTSLEGKVLPDTRRAAAAALLARTGAAAFDSGDDVLALLAAQQALRHAPTEKTALRVAARACLKQQEFSAAERYADRWLVVDEGRADARLFRAELASEQGEWKHVLDLLKPLSKGRALSAAQADRRDVLAKKANDELAAIETGMSVLRDLEKRLKKLPSIPPSRPLDVDPASDHVSPGASKNAGITLYSTTWCTYCKKARKWLQQKGVAFVERDVERDPSAESDLQAAASRAGVQVRGVPVIDVRGTLVMGFDVGRFEAALR